MAGKFPPATEKPVPEIESELMVTGAVPLVAEVTAGAVRELQLDEGASVWTTIKATDITVYPA